MRSNNRSLARRIVGAAALAVASAGFAVPLAAPAEAVLCDTPGATTVPGGTATASVYAGSDGASAAVCEPSIGDARLRAGVTTSGASVEYSSCTAYYGPHCSSGNLVDAGVGRDANGVVAASHGGNAAYQPVCSRPVLDTAYYGCTNGVGIGVATTGNASGPLGASATGSASGPVSVTGTGDSNGGVLATSLAGETYGPHRVSSDGADAPLPVGVPGQIIVAVKTLLPRCSHLMALLALGQDCPSWYPGYPSTGQGEDGYECDSCFGHNGMQWEDYGDNEIVRFFNNYNSSTEVIDKQDHHGALIRAKGKCNTAKAYEGDIVRRAFSGDKYRWATTSELEVDYYTGYNATWTAASGHNWYDGGSHWAVNTVTDLCKKF